MSHADFFEPLPAFLPCWLPGETLFSWSARYHRLVGGGSAMGSSTQLFGCDKAGLKHDFPFHLARFATINCGLLGTPESIALERTLLQYYAPFLTTNDLSSAISLMRGPTVATLKNLLGILPSRIGAAHPLKACEECIIADLHEYGLSLWHLQHQWPSSWVCRKHGVRLIQLGHGIPVVGHDLWLLPGDVRQSAWVRYFSANKRGIETLSKIADASAGFISSPHIRFDSRILRYAYLKAAQGLGWLSPDASLRLSLVREAFLRHFQAISDIPSFAFLNTVCDVNGGVIGLLMRQHPGRRHPLKHALAVAFLFESFSDFFAAYNRAELVAHEVGPQNIHRLLASEFRVRLRRLVEDDHRSVSSAARVLGISEGLANQWARAGKFDYESRPRVLNRELEKELRQQISEGSDYASIGSTLSVRKGFVRSYVAKNPDLHEQWLRARFDIKRDCHRREFLSIVATHAGWTLKAIRRIPGNGVAWLMRHDREWLREHLCDIGMFRHSKHE